MDFELIDETNCKASNIKNADKILIGGSCLGAFNLQVEVDSERFSSFFEQVQDTAKKLTANEPMKEWLQKVAPDFDVELFAHLYSLNALMRKVYPDLSSNINQRKGFYDIDGNKKLSDAFENKVCACAEMSLLSQIYLQKQGFDSQYWGGELLRSPTEEFGEPHSFINIKYKDKEYFFDPANPIQSGETLLPRIAAPEVSEIQKTQFENKIHSKENKRKCAFLETREVLSGSKWYYGFGDGANIFESFIFYKNQPNNKTTEK